MTSIRVHRGSTAYDPSGDTPDLVPGQTIAGWSIAPRSSGTERASSNIDARNRQGVIAGLTAYNHNPTVDIRDTDEIEILDGPYASPDRYKVEGDIGRWPLGVEMALRRAKG